MKKIKNKNIKPIKIIKELIISKLLKFCERIQVSVSISKNFNK